MELVMIITISWCSALTVLWLILAVLFIILWKKVSRLTQYQNSLGDNVSPNNQPKGASVYNYGSPAIEPGEDLARRGYSKHGPRPITPDANDDSRYAKPKLYSSNSNVHSRYDENNGPVFGSDYDAPSAANKPARKSHQPPKKSASDVPHFFETQLARAGRPPSPIKNNNPRVQELSDSNFHY